jgi:hypothetical protein
MSKTTSTKKDTAVKAAAKKSAASGSGKPVSEPPSARTAASNKTPPKAEPEKYPAQKTACCHDESECTAEVDLDADAIATCAYYLWEKEGFQHGRDSEHWFRAEEQLRAEISARLRKPRALH